MKNSQYSHDDFRQYTKRWAAVNKFTGSAAPSVAAAAALMALTVLLPATAQIIPSDRSINWSQSGIPGGIPKRTTICSLVPAGASASTIQSALNSCPANQVVLLAAGTYNISGGLTIPSNVVLRGAGTKATVLNASGSGGGFIRFGVGSTPSTSNSTSITGGATAGSTSLTVSSTSGITVGSHLMVTQLNDSSYVTITTNNGTCTWCDGGIGWNGTRVQGQIVEVTSVSGSTVGISPGLYKAYTQTPLATRLAMGARNAGVEDLQVYMNNTGYTANFLMSGTANSWIKNVESNYTDGDHVQMHWGYRNEIRDSYFHDGFTHSPGSTESCIFIANKSSANLVENNVLRRLHASIMLNWGAAGNVIGYNYMDNNFDSAGYNTLFTGLSFHGAHPAFNLIEGNIAPKLEADYYWGSSSHNTLLRNWFKGVGQIIPPLTGRGAEQTSSAYWASQALVGIDLSQTVRYFNLLGNIIGSDRQKTMSWTLQRVALETRSFYTSNNHYGYTFGYANLSDTGSDSRNNSLPYTTAIIHGDYDYVSSATKWDATITDHNVPASLYRSSKPSWFGSLEWPAFGPSVGDPSKILIGSIPAKTCFDQGSMPACLAGGSEDASLPVPGGVTAD